MYIKVPIIFVIIAVSNYSLAQSDLIFKAGFEKYQVQKLNDTGITWAGEAPTGNVACNSTTFTYPQDCNAGRDATHNDNSDGRAGFSFTKLDASGVPLVDQSVDYQTTPWACVQDNVTGLIWEVKTDDGGIHDKDNAYKWGGLTALGREHINRIGDYYDDWNSLVNGSNNEVLCGVSDWRVPVVSELSSIINRGSINPSIDTNYFPNAVTKFFWAASPTAFYSGTNAWAVSFENGGDGNYSRDQFNVRVRLVYSGE